MLAILIAACATEDVPDGKGGGAGAGGNSVAAGGSGGVAGAGGVAGSGGTDARVLCTGSPCECTRDCCSLTETFDATFDELRNEFYCPAGHMEWETCDPASCPCDRETQDHFCVQECCYADDVFMSQVCVDGEWTCRGPHSSVDYFAECAPLYESDGCPCESKRKWPAERCDAEGELVCEVTPAVLDVCFGIVCRSCAGFDGPIESDSCRCECRDGAVWCDPTGS